MYFSARQEEKYLKNFEIKYKKQLSKQAKKDIAINKANSSNLHWEENI
ncbi:unknown [Clostridium sp. CAG:921]|nr:unknown [Clostridium sp. CAG:921]